MEQKQILFKIKGMQRDLSNSTFRSEYAFENMNLRITADKDNGLLSITNEKGTKNILISEKIFNKIYIDGRDIKFTYPVASDIRIIYLTSSGGREEVIQKGQSQLTSYNGSPVTGITAVVPQQDDTYIYGEKPVEFNIGNIIGVAEINNKAVIFHFREDSYESCITLLSLENYEGTSWIKATPLYKGRIGWNDLNFSTDHPIETLVDIENENIQKVYWVDGINQPRVINIAGEIDSNDPKQFDFVPEINGGELEVEHSEASGQFPAGVIQYAFTYFNKYKQESAVVDVSPIYYIAKEDRGAAPNDIVNKSFKITFNNLDTNWEYIRLYSIIRTSENTTPEVKKVVDLSLPVDETELYFIDTGSSGEYIAPTDLLYKGGEVLSASTLTSKDGTLFLGDLDIINNSTISQDIKDVFKGFNVERSVKINKLPDKDIPLYTGEYNSEKSVGEHYQYTTSLNKNSLNTKHFKTGDYYRLGVQLQDKYGKWSDPIFIKDDSITHYPKYIELPRGLHFDGAISVEDAELYLNSNDVDATNVYTLSENGHLTASPDGVKKAFEYGDLISITGYGTNDAWYYIGTVLGDPSNLLDKGTKKYYTNIKYNSVGDTGDVLIYYEKTGEYTIISNEMGFAEVISFQPTTAGERTYSIDVIITNPIGFPSITNFTVTITNDNYEVYHISKDIKYWEKLENELNNGEIIDSIANIFEIFKLNNYNTSLLQSYTKIRPVIVYPEENDREVICQGVLCPTVFNVKDRSENGPFVQSSWMFRFYPPTEISEEDPTDNKLYRDSGVWAEYRHFKPIFGLCENAEKFTSNVDIKTLIYNGEFNTANNKSVYDDPNLENTPEDTIINMPPLRSSTAIIEQGKDYFTTTHENRFFVDSSYLTFHSPEIEFLNNSDYSSKNIKARLVGIVPITASNSGVDIQGVVTDLDPLSGGGINNIITKSYNKSRWAFRKNINASNVNDNFNTSSEDATIVKYSVTLWNPSTRFTFPKLEVNKNNYLSKVRTSNISYSHNSVFFNLGNKTIISPSDIKVWDNNNSFIKLSDNTYYTGISDKVINTDQTYIPITMFSDSENLDLTVPISLVRFNEFESLRPIPITYTSTKHAVIKMPENTFLSNVMLDGTIVSGYPFWNSDTFTGYSTIASSVESKYGYLYLAELYRDVSEEIKFGGTSEYALQNNLWLPAGKAVNIGEPIIWEEGDTYYQRYDCVKTLPRNDSDLNGVTDVLSFMCETRVNLDGRYDDRYKFVEEPLLITSDNINKLNEVYNQPNNFFNYRILDSERFNINNFPNTIVWSKTKQPNNIVDNWTNINLASSLDLDGNKGKVTSLKVFNDNIIAFQDKAISQVLFNSRVQINASDGVPIEISNSGKVDGKRYLSNNIGCLNKHSICDSTNGIYFIDDYNNSIYLFNGQFNNLSESKGFHSWMKNNSSLDTWDPVNFKNVVTYRDSINNEILFIYKDKCLVYNEVLGEFSSFYSYEDTPYMFTLKDKNILYNRNQSNLWVKNEGEYNNFFGTYKDFYTTIIANDNPTYDKIFSTLDFRADVLNDNNKMINSTPTAPFNYLKVVNEYQEVESNLSGKSLIPKFRVWRAQFPRLGKNRIRNPWATITLGNKVNNRRGINEKVRLHDIVVNYFI